jgi:hypothetical protein
MSSDTTSFYYSASGAKYSDDWRSTISSLLKQTERNLEKNPSLPIPVKKASTGPGSARIIVSTEKFPSDLDKKDVGYVSDNLVQVASVITYTLQVNELRRQNQDLTKEMVQLRQDQYTNFPQQSARHDMSDSNQEYCEPTGQSLKKELASLKENYDKLLPEMQAISKEKPQLEQSIKENYLLCLELKEKQGYLNNSQSMLQRDYQQSNLDTKIQIEVLKKEMESAKGIQFNLSVY